jgi:hypothetical protein
MMLEWPQHVAEDILRVQERLQERSYFIMIGGTQGTNSIHHTSTVQICTMKGPDLDIANIHVI